LSMELRAAGFMPAQRMSGDKPRGSLPPALQVRHSARPTHPRGHRSRAGWEGIGYGTPARLPAGGENGGCHKTVYCPSESYYDIVKSPLRPFLPRCESFWRSWCTTFRTCGCCSRIRLTPCTGRGIRVPSWGDARRCESYWASEKHCNEAHQREAGFPGKTIAGGCITFLNINRRSSRAQSV
jgi:hypothetical protein